MHMRDVSSKPDPVLPQLAALLARGYLRLKRSASRNPVNQALSFSEKRGSLSEPRNGSESPKTRSA
jgi:hypothetical protein